MRILRLQLTAALAISGAALVSAPVFGAPMNGAAKGVDPIVTAAMDMMIKAGDLELTGMWARAMLPGQPAGGGFVTIRNTGTEDDRLLSVSTDAAGMAQVHEMAIVDGIMKMRHLADGLVIPAGETVELKPGGYHLMFMKVTEPFREGATVKVTLTFQKAGTVELELPVRPANTMKMQMNNG